MKFYKNEFLEYMTKNYKIDDLTKDFLEGIINYGEKHQNVNKYQILHFIYEIFREVYYVSHKEIAQFYK